MNDLEQGIIDILAEHPDGLSTVEVSDILKERGLFPDCRNPQSRVDKNLKSLWKYKFVNRSATRHKIAHRRTAYLWRVYTDDDKIWSADIIERNEEDTIKQHRKKVEKFIKQFDSNEAWI